MFIVTIFDMGDGLVDGVYGPFDNAVDAMNWIDQEIAQELQENPHWTHESADDSVMVTNNSEEDLQGFLYQVLELESPNAEPMRRLDDAGDDRDVV